MNVMGFRGLFVCLIYQASIDASIDGIVKVLKMTSCLIVKPSEGSHGVGVMKLLYKEVVLYKQSGSF